MVDEWETFSFFFNFFLFFYEWENCKEQNIQKFTHVGAMSTLVTEEPDPVAEPTIPSNVIIPTARPIMLQSM